MKKLVKIAALLLIILVVLIGIGVGIVFYNIDSLAKRGIEEGGTYALGVPTTVGSVSLHIFSGDLTMAEFNVANPPGFGADHFLTLKKGEVVVTLDSLNKDVVDIPKLSLSGIDVNLERSSSGSNYGKIIEHLSKLKGAPSAPAPSEKPKRYIVHDLTIDGINIHADMLGAPGPIGQVLNPVGKANVPIEHIALKDVGRTGTGVGGTGVTMEELTSIVVQAVLAAAADKGYGTIPGEILNDLKGAVSSLGGLANIPVSVVGKTGEAVTQIGGAIENLGKSAGDAANNAGKEITQSIEGLLGGSKDPKKGDPKKNDPKNPPKKP